MYLVSAKNTDKYIYTTKDDSCPTALYNLLLTDYPILSIVNHSLCLWPTESASRHCVGFWMNDDKQIRVLMIFE
jgi:hypothetical protein